jgi:hypothetical protein
MGGENAIAAEDHGHAAEFVIYKLAAWVIFSSMIFSDLASPAEALKRSSQIIALGFAQAGNRYPLFGIMLLTDCSPLHHRHNGRKDCCHATVAFRWRKQRG